MAKKCSIFDLRVKINSLIALTDKQDELLAEKNVTISRLKAEIKEWEESSPYHDDNRPSKG